MREPFSSVKRGGSGTWAVPEREGKTEEMSPMALGAVVMVLMLRRRREHIVDLLVLRRRTDILWRRWLEDVEEIMRVFIVLWLHGGLFPVCGKTSGFGSANTGLGVEAGCSGAMRIRGMTT
jgi:hypothetical protein